MQTNYWLKNSQKEYYPFFIVKVFFLKTSYISALMIVINLLFFSIIHCCFVYLRFQRICLWLINALKEERKRETVVLFFLFFFFVLNLIVFVYNGLKQSLILKTKPNCFLQICSFHRILMFILKKHLAPYIETWVRVCCYVRHLCLHLLCFFASLC